MQNTTLQARRLSVSALARPVITLAILLAGLATVALFVTAALGDPLIGLLAALTAFSVSAPVLGPLLGAIDRSARS